jgi:hypothetical protein
VALATVNGVPVIRGTINMPLLGAWTADVVADSDEAMTGSAAIVLDGGLTLQGSIVRGDVFVGSLYLRIVGGAGGLMKASRVQDYRQTTVRGVASDLVRVAGERLSTTADASVLGTQLIAWTQVAQPVGSALTSLASDRRFGGAVAWRVLPDGSIWFGRETWPDAGLTAPTDYQEIGALPSEGWMELGFAVPTIGPGVTIGGRRVAFIQHSIDGDEVRTKAWLSA